MIPLALISARTGSQGRRGKKVADLGGAADRFRCANGGGESLIESDMLSELASKMMSRAGHVTLYTSFEMDMPLVDPAVIAAQRTLPVTVKIAGLTGKISLRARLSHHLSPDVSERQKQAFRALPTSGFHIELADRVRAWLLDAPEATGEGVDRAMIGRLVIDHVAAPADHSVRIWVLVALQSWLDGLSGLRTIVRKRLRTING